MQKTIEKQNEIRKGMLFNFAPTGKIIRIEKVTDKNVSWYTGIIYMSAYGKKVMRMVHTSVRIFNEGINRGSYVLID